MPNGTAERLDFAMTEEDWGEAPLLGAPSPEQLQAELATLPTKPPRKPGGSLTMTMTEAGALLGVSRAAVRNYIRQGKIRNVGKDGHERNVLDRAEVEAFAADRQTATFERTATGPALEQHRIAKEQSLEEDPRTMGRARGGADARRMHGELVAELRAVKEEIGFGDQRLRNKLDELVLEMRSMTSALDTIRTILIGGAAAAGVAAVLPGHVKEGLRAKVAGGFGFGKPEEKIQGPPATAMEPVGAKEMRTIGGEVLARPELDDEEIERVTEGLNQILRMRVEGSPGESKR